MTPPAGPSARSWDAAAIVSVAAALVGDGGSFFSGMEGLSARATAARCNRAFEQLFGYGPGELDGQIPAHAGTGAGDDDDLVAKVLHDVSFGIGAGPRNTA